MKFADARHQEMFTKLAVKYDAIQNFNVPERDVAAALFLLSSPLLARRCSEYVARREIDFPKLMRDIGPWSSGEKALVKLAAALYNNCWKCDVNDAFWSLDEGSIELALEALRIRWG